MHLTEVPRGRPQVEPFQMPETGGHLKAHARQAERPVGAALGAAHLGGEGERHGFGRRRRPADVGTILIRGQRTLPQLRVLLAVVFHLDPRLGRLVQLAQRQVGHALEHRQEPSFDLGPKVFLFPILMG